MCSALGYAAGLCSECDWSVAHAARGAEGGESRSQDADDDLQEGLPSFFLHRGLRFEI